MFLQGVQDISTTRSGFITTPFGFLAAFMGVPVGYLLARSSRFKWMYISGYGILTLSMFTLIFFNAGTSMGWSVAIALLAGLGYGVIPTINTIVVQNAVPKRLMGVAMGAIFFFLMMGSAISPAILGSTMNVSYAKALSQSLPEGLRDIADETTICSPWGIRKFFCRNQPWRNLKRPYRERGPGISNCSNRRWGQSAILWKPDCAPFLGLVRQ